jgi:immunoglobulin I-set domain protein
MRLWVIALVFGVPAQIHGQLFTFQEGVDGYVGTLDTQLRLASSNSSAATATSLIADNRDGADPPGPAQILLRFDNMFGVWPGQIPPGTVIQRAELILSSSVNDAQSIGTISLHRLLQDWMEDCNWATCFGGDSAQLNNIEAIATPDATFVPDFPNPSTDGTQRRTNDVTASVQAWSDGQANYGWVLINSSDDSYRIDSSEWANPANRPRLRVIRQGCPLSFTQYPTNATVAQCGTAVFTAQVLGVSPITFQWKKDERPIDPIANPSATTSTLTLTNVQETDEGSYSVTADNDCAYEETSAAARLTVIPDTQPPTLVSAIGQRDGVTINITFSEPMNDAATDNRNYTICNIADPSDCLPLSTPGSFSFGRMTVTLTSAIPRTACVAYEVRAQRVADACGGNLIAPNSTIPLRSDPCLCISLEIQPGGTKLVRIVWPCPSGSPPATGFVLESADKLGSPWTPVDGATSPYVIPADAAQQFYRLGR